jgi:hypothetical protein
LPEQKVDAMHGAEVHGSKYMGRFSIPEEASSASSEILFVRILVSSE